MVWLPRTEAPSKVVWRIWGFLEVELGSSQHQCGISPAVGGAVFGGLLGVL